MGMSSKETIALMRSEIADINSMKTEPVEWVYVKNEETKRVEKTLVRCSDMIINSLSEKRVTNITSKKYTFETSYVLPYSEANTYGNVGGKFTVKHTAKYNTYAHDVKRWFDKENGDGMLKYFLSQNKIMIIINFKLVNIQKDLDNVTKPFLDCLFFNVDKNDNRVKRTLSNVEKSHDKHDHIEIQIIKLKEEDWEKGLFIDNTEYSKEFYYDSIF